jgi:LysM repeat protein
MDVDSSSKSGISSMMPLAIGILGTLVGVVALIMSFNNSSKITALTSSVSDAAQAASDAKTAASAATGLSAKLDATSSKLDAFIAQAQSVLDAYTKKITEDDTKITELADTVSKMGHGTVAKAGTSPASKVVPGQGGTHTIAPGDTFSNLAKKYNVSVKAIEDANPGVDPSKLHSGQVVTIPGSKTSASAPAPSSAPAAETGTPAPAVTQ